MVKRNNQLQVYNPIYREVFNQKWIDNKLAALRPYSEAFRAWFNSGREDNSWLLRGNALQTAEKWVADKNLGFQDKEFLAASRQQEREEENAQKDKEAELKREKELREAAEEAERIQGEANRQAQRRIRIGNIVLGLALLGGLICFGWGFKVATNATNTNQALKAVRGLSQLAGQLRKKGQVEAVEASDEALRKAGLSTLIENEELKQVWLMAATAEAYPSLGDEELKDAEKTVENLNLNSLNNSHIQVDSRIVNQVKAFAYFQAAKFKNEKTIRMLIMPSKQVTLTPIIVILILIF